MKSIFGSILFLCLLCYTTGAWATGQVPDKLIYKGTEYSIYSNPLTSYFEEYPDRRPRVSVISSAVSRGYEATFGITGKKLYVKEIDFYGYNPGGGEPAMKTVFPGSDGPVPMTWYTGTIAAPYGKVTTRPRPGTLPEYSRYMVIDIREGIVVKVRKMNSKSYKRSIEKQ